MSNAYSLLSTGNTFGDWIVTTNALTKENNDFHANSYHKNAGTLYLDDATLGLQVNNQAIFAGAFQVTGAGSSATIQNNLTVQSGQVYFQNTILSLVASGNVTAPNVISTNVTVSGNILSSNVYVTKNLTTSNIVATGSVYVTSNVTTSNVVASNVYVISNVTTSNIVATGSVFVTSNVTTSNVVATGGVYVTSNINAANVVSTNVTASSNVISSNVFVTSNVTTSNIVATGSVYVTTNINAANIVSTNVTASGNIFSSNVFVTSNVTTSNIVATGSVYVTSNVTTSNVVATDSVFVTGNVNSGNLISTGIAYISGNVNASNVISTNVTASGNVISSNVFVTSNITTSNIVAGSIFVTSNITTANIVTTGNVWVTSNVQAANVVASRLYVSGPTQLTGTTQLVGTANTTADLGIGGNLNVPNVLFMGGSTSSANIYSLTVGQSAGNGGLTVQGNFTIAQPTIYQAPSFTLYGGTAITGGNFAYFNVNRSPSTNASIRWNETNKEFAVANVDSSVFYRIVTDEYASGSSSSANSMTYPTSYALANANTFLQTYNNTANTGLKSYGDATYFAKTGGTISGTVTISSGGLISTVSPVGITSGGTNNNTYTTGQVLQYNGSSIASLANVTAFAATGSSTAIPIITTDSYGRVTALSTASISTTLGIAGTSGTGSVALASQTLTVTSSTNTITSVVASGQTITIASMASGVSAATYGSSTAIPVLAIDTYGRITSASTTGISTTITLAGGSGSGSVSGGGTLTLTGSTGLTTSVSGSTYTLTNSGVTSFSTSLTGLTPSTSSTGAITLAGTLGVASGGTGVTTSTGTGSVVLNSSPTLVTPALGTPASGTLTNCTFPTLNQNTTGTAAGLSATLAVASGGTGVTTSTGTGSVVLSNSPALVTPTLGTPASGNLSNCTFPTLNQNTSGTAAGLSATLAVASGGTGVTTSTGTGSVVLSASPTFSGTVSGITKAMVGLGSVDNTADASKSVNFATTAGTAGNISAYTINQNLGTGNDVTHAVITGSAFYYSSDARLKTNITELTNHWDILNNLRPVNFDWISTGKKAQGLLAQEVQKVLPEAINTTIDGTLSIDSSGIVAHLIAAIQDLKSQVDELNKKLEK